ncbi:MAG: alpha/beta hydrolase domain-containing protein [Holdemanella porci]
MLTDLAWMLRGNSILNPLKSYAPKYIHLTGWSQSGAYLVRYLNSFAYRDEVKKMDVYSMVILREDAFAIG